MAPTKWMTLVAAILGILLLLAPAVASAGELRRLSNAEATHHMRTVLAREPDFSFRRAYARKVACNKRISRTRVRCRMSWIFGDVEYSGRGMIWHVRSGGGTHWAYAYRVRKRNAYCQATGGSNCVEVITAR